MTTMKVTAEALSMPADHSRVEATMIIASGSNCRCVFCSIALDRYYS